MAPKVRRIGGLTLGGFFPAVVEGLSRPIVGGVMAAHSAQIR